MKKFLIFVILLVSTQGLAELTSLPGLASSDQLREILRNRIEVAGIPARITIGEEPIHASVALPRFYEGRSYQPAWVGMKGPLVQTDSLTKAIREADREGLRPDDYHLANIEAMLEEIRRGKRLKTAASIRSLVDLDLLLTDAFLIYGSHLLAGRVNPENIDGEWQANRREADLVLILQRTLDSNQVEKELKELRPPQPEYARLREALVRYREISATGGWSIMPEGRKLQLGDRSECVPILRRRLIASGDLVLDKDSGGDLYDEALDQAVRRFQQRHGLDADGAIGPATLEALNMSVEDRTRQLEVNLERWRWLPQDLGRRHILINIANFQLNIIENGESLKSMRVVVGRSYRRTPVFSHKMTYLVLSPYWHVPHNIAVQDKLPLIQKDSKYLVEQRIRVFEGWGANAHEIDPRTVDWAQVNAKTFTFRLRQDPGPWNALGGIKFMFPNKFNVYLHDTPSKELFGKTSRTFSSGCIRVEKPIDLAEYVLQGDSQWTREKIVAAMNTDVEQTVQLPEPITVHVLYWTAWVDENRTIQFRRDIYGRDKLLARALRQVPPNS